ncbi:MAG: WG repeat-containing protein [Clostridia bacterium]|nr:WG repeat-containing protein [Clostridia bacterium]
MRFIFARCLLILMCLAMSSGALAEGYVWVIPPQFDDARNFSEGLAVVMVGEKLGFIDKAGKVVVPPQYDAPWWFDYYGSLTFRDGLASVMVSDGETEKWGFIDKTGKEVVPLQYDATEGFREGLAAVMIDGKWGFIDKTGKEIVPPKYGEVYAFRDGLARVMVGNTDRPDVWNVFDDQKWGLIDKTGKEVVPVEYDRVGEFREGRASVVKNELLGFIDETGAVVIPLTYQSPLPSLVAWHMDIMPYFSEGLAAIWGGDTHGNQYGYIDRDGNVAIPFMYDHAAPFSEGLAYVSKGGALEFRDAAEDGKYGFIDKTGEVIVPLVYDCDYWGWGIIDEEFFYDGFATVSKRGTAPWDMKYGMIDQTGKVVVPIRYHWLERLPGGLSFAGYGEDYSGHGTWDSIGLIDETGGEIVAVDYYSWIGYFSEGYAWVRYGGEGGAWMASEESTYGFIDVAGNEVAPCIFEAVGAFSEGLAAVKVDGKWGYIAIAK